MRPGGGDLLSRAFVVLGAVAAAFAAPIISVLWMVIALNFLLGRTREHPILDVRDVLYACYHGMDAPL